MKLLKFVCADRRKTFSLFSRSANSLRRRHARKLYFVFFTDAFGPQPFPSYWEKHLWRHRPCWSSGFLSSFRRFPAAGECRKSPHIRVIHESPLICGLPMINVEFLPRNPLLKCKFTSSYFPVGQGDILLHLRNRSAGMFGILLSPFINGDI